MFKGVLFLLPINGLKKETMSAERHHKEIESLQRELDEETRTLSNQFAWADDLASPTVRVEILASATGPAIAFSDLPVPLLQTSTVEGIIRLPLGGYRARKWCTPFCSNTPSVDFRIRWEPDVKSISRKGAKTVLQPRGSLTLEPLEAFDFGSSAGRSLHCNFIVPCTLYGDARSYTSNGCNQYKWEDSAKDFRIEWESPLETAPEVKCGESKHLEEEYFQRRVLDVLHQQTDHIQQLESRIEEFNAE
jgi:hypothetical protein